MKFRNVLCTFASFALLVGVAAIGDDKKKEFVIDGFRYILPFDTTMYPQRIVDVLRNKEESWSELEQATWYVQLGNAHRYVAEEEELVQNDTNMKEETGKAIAALHLAVEMFEGILTRLEIPIDVPHASQVFVVQLLAASLFNLSEAYWLQQGSSGIEKSQHYNQRALEMYQILMDEHNDLLTETEVNDAELGWAHCQFRIGVALIGTSTARQEPKNDKNEPSPELVNLHMDEILKENMDLVDELAGGDVQLMKETVAMLMEYGVGSLSEQIDNVKQAAEHLVVSIEFFKKAVDRESIVNKRLQLKLQLATAQQNLSSAYQLQEESKLAAKTSEDAYQLFIDIIPQLEGDGNVIDIAQAQRGACELLYMLSSIYLQLNSFELAKDRYRQAMDLFDAYNVLPPAPESSAYALPPGSDLSPQIQEYERLLEEYLDGTATDDVGQYEREGYFDDGQGYLIKDDGYEADIHSSLGVLYMSQGQENVMAAIHLEHAARMYEQNGERDSPNMANVKLSLAELYLQSQDYEKSAVAHAEAINIFRATGATSFAGADTLGGLASLIAQAKQAAQGEQPTTPEGDDIASSTHSRTKPQKSEKILPTDEASGIVIDLQSFLEQNETNHDEL